MQLTKYDISEGGGCVALPLFVNASNRHQINDILRKTQNAVLLSALCAVRMYACMSVWVVVLCVCFDFCQARQIKCCKSIGPGTVLLSSCMDISVAVQ